MLCAHNFSWRPSGWTSGVPESVNVTVQMSSDTSGKPRCTSAAAMVDLPAPDGPQNSTALPLTRTALPCSTICSR